MPEMSDREIQLMYDRLGELQAGQEAMNVKLDSKPCGVHGEALAALEEWHNSHGDGSGDANGGKWLTKNWKWVAALLGAGALGGGTSKAAENFGAILKVFLENMGK